LPDDPSFDIFNPVDDVPRPDITDLLARDEDIRLNRLGIYLQDQISLLDNLKLLVGGRFDLFDQRAKLLTNTLLIKIVNASAPRWLGHQ